MGRSVYLNRPDMKTTQAAFDAIDLVLLVAIVCLSIFLIEEVSGTVLDAWRNRVRPGAQVCQQFVETEGNGPSRLVIVTDYLLYLPPGYDTSRKWPLVVFLHGAGERGQDLERVRHTGLPRMVDEGQKPGFILASPQCPAEASWAPESIVALIDQIGQLYAVDQDRVYLTGFSMGGFGTWTTACYAPDRFAAIIPVAGGGDVQHASRLVNTPAWAFHGDRDNVVPIAANEAMVDAVRKCGGNVQFTVYPGRGHGVCEATYCDRRVLEWLLAQRRRQPSKGQTGK